MLYELIPTMPELRLLPLIERSPRFSPNSPSLPTLSGSSENEGSHEGLVLPSCNTEAMSLHLAEIATQVAPGAHAVLVLDQAGWRLSSHLVVPENITLLPLPPKCSELNPVENIWQFMRDNWLSNRIFKSYEDVLDHCCYAWNRLVDMPWKIMSIGTRDWPTGHSRRDLV
jgi:DDE superfamily endonuclease